MVLSNMIPPKGSDQWFYRGHICHCHCLSHQRGASNKGAEVSNDLVDSARYTDTDTDKTALFLRIFLSWVFPQGPWVASRNRYSFVTSVTALCQDHITPFLVSVDSELVGFSLKETAFFTFFTLTIGILSPLA